MGLVGSKIGKCVPEEVLQQGSVPSTPILAPKVKQDLQNDLFDPRSPSANIARTPLQLLSAAAERLEEYKENDPYTIANETPKTIKKVILGVDPRSPTTDFKRTPIVITADDSELPKKLHNKNLERVRRSAIITTPKSTPERPLLAEPAPKNIVPPKLLKSSPIKAKADANKRKSFVGLLETNIDFTETDLDVVIQEKCRIKETPCKFVSSADIDPRSPTMAFQRTPIQIVKKIGDTDLRDDSIIEIEPNQTDNVSNLEEIELQDDNILENIEKEETVQEIRQTNSAETVLIDRESVLTVPVVKHELPMEIPSLPTQKELSLPTEEEPEELPIEREASCEATLTIIPHEAKSAPSTPPFNTNSHLHFSPVPKALNSAPVSPPFVNLTADVKELDKKLTNLIFEDDIVICPRIVQLKEHSHRSPLRNRNSNEPERKKSAQKLKVSDKPRRSDYAVSKIPVFREKVKNVQCENTPPKSLEKRRGKKSRWDNANNTLII